MRSMRRKRKRYIAAASACTRWQLLGLAVWFGWRCAACGASGRPYVGDYGALVGGLQVDHVIPVGYGGSASVGNVQLLCAGCHVGKAYGVDYRPWSHLVAWGALWGPDVLAGSASRLDGRGLGLSSTPKVPLAGVSCLTARKQGTR